MSESNELESTTTTTTTITATAGTANATVTTGISTATTTVRNDDDVVSTNTSSNNTTNVPYPTNGLVTALLTDLYQITMVYAHWINNRHNDIAIFELFFRKNPFGGEYTIFTGLDEVLKFLYYYKFTKNDIQYLQSIPQLQYCNPEFFNYLLQLDTSKIIVQSMLDGTVVFPRVPLLIIEGPLGITQLLETTLLTLVNYPSLIATNAARMVIAATSHFIINNNDTTTTTTTETETETEAEAVENDNENSIETDTTTTTKVTTNPKQIIRRTTSLRRSGSDKNIVPTIAAKTTTTSTTTNPNVTISTIPTQCTVQPVCVEFGLRRAQGPDGGYSASKYSSVGGFVATSNVQAGKLLGLSLSGTHAHAFVQSYSTLDEVSNNTIQPNNTNDKSTTNTTEKVKLLPIVLKYRQLLSEQYDIGYNQTIDGELAAFVAYATAFPHSFLCLIDTYDTLRSGLFNFIIVSLALYELQYIPIGIRLDSGDLAYLSMECATVFHKFFIQDPIKYLFFSQLSIVASNDINEEVLYALSKQPHAITAFGIGTNLVTCQAQPALGCVYKLVQLSDKPRIKLSQEISKVLIPSKKIAYRLYGKDNYPILDLLTSIDDIIPQSGQRIMCRHPFIARKRAYVTPSKVQTLYTIVFQNGQLVPNTNRSLGDAQLNVQYELNHLRSDIIRYTNPTPYKVSVSETLFNMLHDMWQNETPVAELS